MKPKLTLVGAGPGDPDLITWKGIKALQSASVILYDALANEEILRFARKDALKIPVGKRGGQASFSQDRINQLIVSYALLYGDVVRLKGGDPFIFGRGQEEIDFAARNGLEIAVVPGISSSTGLTSLHNVSLTQRGISDGFWVQTASLKGGEFNKDVYLAAQASSTVVLLMGISQLDKITEVWIQAGKTDIPVLIIQNGSLPGEKVVEGTIRTIRDEVKENGIGSPAIIVIGEVVSHKIKSAAVQAAVGYLN